MCGYRLLDFFVITDDLICFVFLNDFPMTNLMSVALKLHLQTFIRASHQRSTNAVYPEALLKYVINYFFPQ